MERPLRVAELDHVVVRCREQRRSLDFYAGLLGCPEERRIEAIGLVQLRAVATWLRGHGVEVLGEPTERYGARGTGLSLYVLDPDGNIVELKQLPR